MIPATLERFLDADEAHELLPHVEMLQELGISTLDAMVLAASEVSAYDCRRLIERGCSPDQVVQILA